MSARYHIKNPSKSRGKGKRKTFSIFLATPQDDGSTKTSALTDNLDLIAINKKYCEKTLTWDEARKEVEQLRNRLNANIGQYTHYTGNATNDKVLTKYWEKNYEHRPIKNNSKHSARHDLRRAIDALGPLSIVSATKEQIESAIYNSDFDNPKQRRIVARLNQILKFLQREDVKLRLPKKVRKSVNYLTVSEFAKVLEDEKREEIKTLYKVCFYTGARLGEAFHLSTADLSPCKKFVQINYQMTDDGKKAEPKWGSSRPAYIFSEGIAALEKWNEDKKKIDISRTAVSARFRRSCQRVFGAKNLV